MSPIPCSSLENLEMYLLTDSASGMTLADITFILVLFVDNMVTL